MDKYRKKPVVVEAVQYDGTIRSRSMIIDWIKDNGHHAEGCYLTRAHADAGIRSILIRTLEGDMSAAPGWWVIKGIKGEFYPCEPEIFDGLYDKEPEDA